MLIQAQIVGYTGVSPSEAIAGDNGNIKILVVR